MPVPVQLARFMQISSVIQVGPRELFPAQLREAAGLAFPEAVWREVTDFSAVLPVTRAMNAAAEELSNGAMLVLFGGNSPEASAARAWVDEEQLPACGVVVFGGGESDSPASPLPVEDWSLRQLAGALRAAGDQHLAERENARLRGHLLTMARRVSHDLRTPLGGIIATVDMMAEITPGGQETVRPLFSSVDEITAIIARTGFLVKAIAQPQPKTVFNMGKAAVDALLRLEKLITRRQATISRPPSWPEVSGVEGWLEVIWWNLLHNSLRHAGDKPLIVLGWEPIGDGGGSGGEGSKDGWKQKFWIRDSGPGVTPAARGQLFRSFHLLHDPNAPRGFGLAIVRGLVEFQGGTCGYEPLPEGGARFYFTLPGGGGLNADG